jgi:hypothetical protein
MRIATSLIVAGLLAGCATPGPVVQVGPDPECSSEKQCAAMWDAAQIFVARNAQMKMQISTNVLIETFNPPQYGTEIAMRVMREPIGGGSYRLSARAWCNNLFGCSSDPHMLRAAFNRQMAAVTP